MRDFGHGTLLLVLALSIGACGGNGNGSAGTPTVAGVAERLREGGIACDNLVMDTEAFLVREQGSCDTAGGENLVISTFNTNSARDNTNSIAEEFGSISVLGDRWAVTVDTDATAAKVQEAIGGEMG